MKMSLKYSRQNPKQNQQRIQLVIKNKLIPNESRKVLNYFNTNSNTGHVAHLGIIYRNNIFPVDINFFNILCRLPYGLERNVTIPN